MKRILNAMAIVLASAGIASAQGGKRPLSLDDLGRLKEVRDPQCAPDGKSVAFVVSQIDVKEDKPGSAHIWTVGIDGQNERGRSRRAPTASRRRGSAPTGNICRSPRRARARPRATRSGCSIGAAAKRSS